MGDPNNYRNGDIRFSCGIAGSFLKLYKYTVIGTSRKIKTG